MQINHFHCYVPSDQYQIPEKKNLHSFLVLTEVLLPGLFRTL